MEIPSNHLGIYLPSLLLKRDSTRHFKNFRGISCTFQLLEWNGRGGARHGTYAATRPLCGFIEMTQAAEPRRNHTSRFWVFNARHSGPDGPKFSTNGINSTFSLFLYDCSYYYHLLLETFATELKCCFLHMLPSWRLLCPQRKAT